MKAQILYEIGNIKYADKDKPRAGEGEALVRVTRCGICGSDVPRIYRTGAHNMPLIPGHEFTGVVEECSSRQDLVGKRVGIFPLMPCGECPQCRDRHYEMCQNYNYLGSRCDGGFAQYAAVPVWNLIPIPQSVSDDDAAMLEPMTVAVHAIRQIGLIEKMSTGETSEDYEMSLQCADNMDLAKTMNIVVCGLGTIGLLVFLFLKDAGCHNVFCIGNKDIQRQKLMDMGFDESRFCDVRNLDPEEFIRERTGGRGANYYFECIGKSDSYAQAIRCAAASGKVMLLGNPASDMELCKEDYWKILRRQLTLKGTWNSSFFGIDGEGDDWRYALTRLEAWSIKDSSFTPKDLITHRLPLSRLQEGLEIMRNKTEEYVKLMVEVDG